MNKISGKQALSIAFVAVCLSSCASKSLSTHLPPASGKSKAEPFLAANADNPGQQTNVQSSVAFGKYTIVDFGSEGCPSCVKLKPLLEELPKKRPDIVVRCYDVNRAGTQGIDWESPLAVQYGLRSLPALKIYDEHGTLMAEGTPARDQVMALIDKEILNPR